MSKHDVTFGNRILIMTMIIILMAGSFGTVGQEEPMPGSEQDWPKFRYNALNTGSSGTEAPDTNELYWVFEAERGQYDFFGFVSSAAVVDHVVYAGCANGRVYAIDETSGSMIWEYVVEDWIEGVPFPIWSSVGVDPERGHVYAAADNLYCLNMSDGRLQWIFETDSFWEFSSATYEDGIVYIGSSEGYVYAVNAVDGSEKWMFETGEREYDPVSGNEVNKEAGGGVAATPAVGPDLVYIGDFDENLYAIDKETGELTWIQGFEETVPGTQTPIEWGPYDAAAGDGWSSVAIDLEDEMIFLGDTAGKVYGMSMHADDNGLDDDFDGRVDNEGDVVWEYETGDAISASPAFYNGVVYISSWDQNMYAFDPTTGSVEWTESFDGFPWGSVSAADGMVFQCTLDFQGGSRYGYVYAFDAGSGSVKWSFEQPEFMVSTPAPSDGKLLVGDTGYRLILFGPDGPKPDLYVDDVIASETEDGDHIIYAAIGNKGGVRSPPAEVHIYVDDELVFNESFTPLEADELKAASVKVTLDGKAEIKVKVTQMPEAWYHIQEENTGNNDKSLTVGGVAQTISSRPSLFMIGLVLGVIIGWIVFIKIAERKELDEDLDYSETDWEDEEGNEEYPKNG